jgi:hypothetical protein
METSKRGPVTEASGRNRDARGMTLPRALCGRPVQDNTMQRDVGDRAFPIWLLGDSNPKNWQEILVTPLDPRHPARHSIWTPVLDVAQDRVFRAKRARIDTSSLYIRNAIEDPGKKPAENTTDWPAELQNEIDELRRLLIQHRPALLLSFGSFAFEFARRALKQPPNRPFGHWGAVTLGDEFRRRIAKFCPSVTNALPLLHTSVSRGRFVESHDYFSGKQGGNCFEYAGNEIADKLLQHHGELQVWIE